ncbi:lysine N(6)-hydroxylase/L-ornithine N(5)-oxygenase family protein [uncultured Pseudomonas sp.]|uniref:lysine N(6)-hydroxylase/L-ornithine N(5)-oxygenase family protein n=1 Tax=uncultured Pseudomonas sp. TaxID=114707 RepID=UPI0025E0438B|nr:lysine N(6)-hydroxylase/L-ornithine N(5)-oxygenase family protein [uncultured Pseudomonas sp.]
MEQVHDYIGIGFGPSNLALAIAADEQAAERQIQGCFIERKPAFSWHEGMLLEGSTMQISFLKDLATLRNPASRFTFINYLKERGRLEDFINLKTFFPSREEYNDYLGWAAAAFAEQVHYGEEVVAVEPWYRDGSLDAVQVVSRDQQGTLQRRLGRNLILGIGGTPQVPPAFAGLSDARVLHSSAYRGRIEALLADPAQPRRVAVIGGGQSAAEIFQDLTQRFPQVEASLILRGGALKPSDDSPFVNEIFNPSFTDRIYAQSPERRERLFAEYRNTNYSVVDLELIENLYQLFYLQKLRGQERHRLLCERAVVACRPSGQGLELELEGRLDGSRTMLNYDVVILATGYRRDYHQHLLAGLREHLQDGEPDRHYRLPLAAGGAVQVFLQGGCEVSHGLSDTLLSVLAIRSAELVEAMTLASATPLAMRSA